MVCYRENVFKNDNIIDLVTDSNALVFGDFLALMSTYQKQRNQHQHCYSHKN